MKCLTYLKDGPCRPESRLAVGVKSKYKPPLIQLHESFNCQNLKISLKQFQIGVIYPGRGKIQHRAGVFSILGSSARAKTCVFPHFKSPKVGVEECAPSATAPHWVQLQSLINWMLRFPDGNPREFHHL